MECSSALIHGQLVFGVADIRLHRLLRACGSAGERRRQATHPARKKPELLATAPGQVWSWDITKLRGPGRGVWFQLYVVLDMSLADTTAFDDGVVTPRADRPKRRTFTAEYKGQIVAEYDAADHGERGAILRRD